MRNRLLFLFAALLLIGGRAEAQFRAPQPSGLGEAFHVELGYMFWTPTPELLIGSDAFAPSGSTEIDFVHEFDIQDERFREFRAVLKPGRKHKIRFSYVSVKYDEAATLQRTITFNGRTFPVTAPATANIEWNLLRAGYEWDFVARGRGFVGMVTELKYNHVTADLASAPYNLSATADVVAPVPTIGVIARGYPHRAFSITGEFTGFKIPDSLSDTFKAKFYDFDLYGTLNLGRNVGVQGGYRSITADYIVDEDTGDLKLKGPYFGGVLRF